MRDRLKSLMTKKSDIQEHLPLLQKMAKKCKVIVEFGFRTGISTTALLCSDATVYSYDIAKCRPHVGNLLSLAGERFRFTQQDSATANIPECDMLFIDSRHTAEQLTKELAHEGKVRRWIVMHDTETFGAFGQDGKPGLTKAIDAFLGKHESWKLDLRLRNCNGLTVLKRVVVQLLGR